MPGYKIIDELDLIPKELINSVKHMLGEIINPGPPLLDKPTFGMPGLGKRLVMTAFNDSGLRNIEPYDSNKDKEVNSQIWGKVKTNREHFLDELDRTHSMDVIKLSHPEYLLHAEIVANMKLVYLNECSNLEYRDSKLDWNINSRTINDGIKIPAPFSNPSNMYYDELDWEYFCTPRMDSGVFGIKDILEPRTVKFALEKPTIFKFYLPLINKGEKHTLTFNSSLTGYVMCVSDDLGNRSEVVDVDKSSLTFTSSGNAMYFIIQQKMVNDLINSLDKTQYNVPNEEDYNPIFENKIKVKRNLYDVDPLLAMDKKLPRNVRRKKLKLIRSSKVHDS